MFIIKCCHGGYLVSGPRKNKKEGCCYTDNRLDYSVKRFDTKETAQAYLADIRCQQSKWGWPAYKRVKAFVCPQ